MIVYSVSGETAIFSAPKAAPIGKECICFFIQTNAKIKFSQLWARNKWAGNMLIFHVEVTMEGQKALGFHQNILICVLKINKGLTGLERREAE